MPGPSCSDEQSAINKANLSVSELKEGIYRLVLETLWVFQKFGAKIYSLNNLVSIYLNLIL